MLPNRTINITFLLVLTALLFIAGCAAQPKKWNKYENAAYGISFEYPDNWKPIENFTQSRESRTAELGFGNVSAGIRQGTIVPIAGFNITEYFTTVGRVEIIRFDSKDMTSSEARDAYKNGVVSSAKARGATVTINKEDDWVVSGQPAYFLETTLSYEGLNVKSMLVVVNKGGYMYKIQHVSLLSSKESTNDFAKMVGTFKFLP